MPLIMCFSYEIPVSTFCVSGLLLMFERRIHIAVHGCKLFISISVFYCMNILYQLYWWTFDGHLACFQFGAVLKYCFEHSSTCLLVSMCMYFSWVCSGMVGVYISCHTVFQTGYPNLDSAVALHPQQHTLKLYKEGKKRIHLLSSYYDLLYHYWDRCRYIVILMLLIRKLMKTKKVIQTPIM